MNGKTEEELILLLVQIESFVYTMASDRIKLTPVNWDQNIHALRKFRDILQTSMGPHGSLKAVVTGGGFLQVTSTSATLMARLELEHPVCRFIGHVTSGLPNFGLYFAVLVSHLVERLWSQDILPKLKLSTIVQYYMKTFQEMLDSNHVCKKVDFSSINSFLPLVRTVITSKCLLCADFDVESFCIQIVKVFLNCLDDQTNSVGRIYVKAKSGPTHFSSYSGLLYQLEEDWNLEILKTVVGEVRVIVFTAKLGNEENKVVDTNKMIKILELAIQSGTKVVACQKTVEKDINLFLMRRKILLLERMGSEFTQEVLLSSKAFPISDISFDLCDVEHLLGCFSSIEHVQFSERDYILLKSNHNSVGTLVLQTNSLVGPDELKALAKQAIGSLRSLAIHPTLTLGGGCLEIWMITQIYLLEQESRADKEFCEVSGWIQQALLSACGPSPPDMTDSIYHHGWNEEGTQCRCGLVTRVLLEKEEGKLISLSEVMSSYSGLNLNPPRNTNTVITSNVLVDSHQQKLNVIISALETFANLSDLGFIVYKD